MSEPAQPTAADTSQVLARSGVAPRTDPARLPFVQRTTLALALAWLVLVAALGWWTSERIRSSQLDDMVSSSAHEARATARIVDRLFAEMVSVSSMVARQRLVIEVAARHRNDAPGDAQRPREQRVAKLTLDPQVREVGDYLQGVVGDLQYGRINVMNLDGTVIASNTWADGGGALGANYQDRIYLSDALRDGRASQFAVGRGSGLAPGFFASSRIGNAKNVPLGVVAVKFDAVDVAPYLEGRNLSLIVNRQGRVVAHRNPLSCCATWPHCCRRGRCAPPRVASRRASPWRFAHRPTRCVPSTG